METSGKTAKRGFLVTLLVLLGLSVFFYVNFKTVVVSGDSMETSYQSGDRLLASKAYWLIGPVQKRDVIVIRDPLNPQGYIIKRVLGLAGDVIDFENVPTDWKLAMGEYKVPEDSVYVIGDNRVVSEDSRRFGPVDASTVLGKIVHIGPSNVGMSALVFLTFVFGAAMLWFAIKLVLKK